MSYYYGHLRRRKKKEEKRKEKKKKKKRKKREKRKGETFNAYKNLRVILYNTEVINSIVELIVHSPVGKLA